MLIGPEREAAAGMGSTMELFEQIRKDRDREGLSIRVLAARQGVHRRAARQVLASPVPPAKRAPVCRQAPKLGACLREPKSGLPRSIPRTTVGDGPRLHRLPNSAWDVEDRPWSALTPVGAVFAR